MAPLLSESQSLALQTFLRDSGLSNHDHATRILKSHEWNIAAALRTLRAVGLDSNSSSHRVSTTETATSNHHTRHSSDINNADNMNTRSSLLNHSQSSSIFWSLLSFPSYILFQTLKWAGLVTDVPTRHERLTPIERFERDYERHYTITHPVFFQGNFTEALAASRAASKLLVIYLHSELHDDSPSFCSGTLGAIEIIDYLNNNFLMWAASIGDIEGYQLSMRLRVQCYPFLCVLAPDTTPQLTMYERIEGYIAPLPLLERLDALASTYNDSLSSSRAQQIRREEERNLRANQDLEYQQALERDRSMEIERVERQRREDEKKANQERETQQKLAAAQEVERQRVIEAKEREARFMALPNEPHQNEPNVSTVQIRLCNGDKISRRFLRSHCVRVLYEFVSTQELIDTEGNVVSKWELLSNYPRRTYREQHLTLEEAHIGIQTTLFVQQIWT